VNNTAIDNGGNIWAVPTGTLGGLFEISPTGTPLTCGLGSAVNGVTSMALDIDGNAWVGSTTKSGAPSSYSMIKWSSVSGTLESTWPTSTSYSPTVIAGDGNGNVFYVDSNGGVNEFVAAAKSGATVVPPASIGALTSSVNAIYMEADASGNLWVPNSNDTTALYEVYPSTNTGGSTYLNGFQTGTITSTALYNPYGIAVGYNGGTELFSSNGAGSGSGGNSYKWDFIVPGTTGTATVTNSAVELAGNYSTRGVAVDGVSNVWQANNNAATGNWVTGATMSGLFSLIEISANGAALSATSKTGTGAYGTNPGGFQKPAAFLGTGARGISVDPTGNVWTGQNSSTGATVMELVGAAVPVVTPLAYGAAQNKLGQKP